MLKVNGSMDAPDSPDVCFSTGLTTRRSRCFAEYGKPTGHSFAAFSQIVFKDGVTYCVGGFN